MNAESINSLANWLFIGSLIVGVFSVYAIIKSGEIIQDELLREISQANENAENAKLKSTDLENNAPIARLEKEKLKQQFSWRRLNRTQFDIISKGLLKIETKTKIILSAIASDPESLTFAYDIKQAIEAGNFEVTVRPCMFFFKDQPPNGITISGPIEEDLVEVAQPFTDAGLNLGGHISPNQKGIDILIASRPPPII